jgi:cytochrome P450
MSEGFDPFALAHDPFPAFARARTEGGFLYGRPPFPGFETSVYLFTHRLVEAALKHPRLLHVAAGAYEATVQSIAGQHLLGVMMRSVLCADPPRHAVFRRPLSQAMTPGRTAPLSDSLRSRALALSDRLSCIGRFDAVQDLAVPFAISALCQLLGISMPETAVLRTATEAMIGAIDLRRTDSAGDCLALEAHVEATLTARDVKPDGLVATMLAQEAAGFWTHDDVVVNILLMMFAGQQTVVDSFANALMALDAAPAQRELLEQGKVSWTNAAEELLRIGSPIIYAGARIAVEDLNLDGIAIKSGTAVIPVIASANRDTAVCPGGDELRLDAPGAAVMSFGTGIHVCLGRYLARAELAALLEGLFTTAPRWSLDRPSVRQRMSPMFRGLTSAQVNVAAGPSAFQT